MKIQMKVRQCRHLGYVSARTNLHIGTGLEGRIQTYQSAAGQLLQMDMRQWFIFLQTTVRYISSAIY
jgi:hypothetical protein